MQDNVVAVAYSLVIATSRMEKDAEMFLKMIQKLI